MQKTLAFTYAQYVLLWSRMEHQDQRNGSQVQRKQEEENINLKKKMTSYPMDKAHVYGSWCLTGRHHPSIGAKCCSLKYPSKKFQCFANPCHLTST
jgi:hypothetical protein